MSNTPTMSGATHKSISNITVSTPGVEKLLEGLNTGKASGPDAIPNSVLKLGAPQLAPILSAIFKQSLETGTLPKDWLKANVSPIYKKGGRHLPVNYRPVSLTSVSCKLLEHLVCKHVRAHLEQNNILTPLQHGFRRGHSCESQLLTTIQDILKGVDNNTQVDIVILDFSKAFDVVPHRRLMSKMRHYGVNGQIHNWIRAFLSGRTQSVIVGGESSGYVPVTSGVPQGTVLGPLLFLCYINDLPASVRSQIRLFADDCLLYRQIKSLKDHAILQEDLNFLEEWAVRWQMKFNFKKCYVMKIHRARLCKGGSYTFCDSILEQVKHSPYLGVMLSEDASWGEHVDRTVKKANSTLGFLRRNLRHCPVKLKELAYNSLVRSALEYACVVWDPHTQKGIRQLEAVQRRAARFVQGDYGRHSSVTAMISNLQWDSLQARRRQARLVMMYKILHRSVAIPADHILTVNTSRTRSSHHLKLHHLATNSTAYKQSFFPRTIPEWNALPQSLVGSETADIFKCRLSKLD